MGYTSSVIKHPAPDDRTRSHVWEDHAATRVVAFWEGGSASHALPEPGVVVVGRAVECELRIDHASVSRAHLRVHGGRVVHVEDLGSSNGTRVGGKRIPANTRVPLAPGEVVEAGSAMIVLQSRQAEVQPPGPGEARVRPMEQLEKLVSLVATGRLSVILLGETGVGKDVTATRIHTLSSRAKGPFVRLNCATLTETLLEGELFGYERGAFTGAVKAKPGLLETGSGGTVFLDELGEMPQSTQAKVLRVLENQEVLRLGGLTPRRIDVRFIGATNRDLPSLVAEGSFRQDLYFRLNGITLAIPPLRQRTDEILPLAKRFLDAAGAPSISLSADARAALLAHSWEGNIRELKNVIERAVVLSEGKTIERAHLRFDSEGAAFGAEPAASLSRTMASFERERILAALESASGNQTEAARKLGVSRRTLVSRLSEYDLPRPRKGRG
jgi:DNA-binding NtrC family response regulator